MSLSNRFITLLFGARAGVIYVLSSLCCAGANALESKTLFDELANASVSRLEWGIDKMSRGLVEIFAIDPLSLATSDPRFFINVEYQNEEAKILIEIGRTFPSIGEKAAREECQTYLGRVRGFLSVDLSGRPAIKGMSSLVEDFFQSPREVEVNEEFARALDRRVVLRGLVASPLNGVYAICDAPLVDGPIRHVR